MSPCRTNLPIRICFVTTFSSAFHLKADQFAQPWQLFSDFIPEFSKTSQIIQPLSANVFPASSLISPWHFEKCESDADVSGWRPRRFLWLDSYGAKLIRQREYVENYSTDLTGLDFERFALMVPERRESTRLGCVLNQNFCNGATIITYDGQIQMISGAGGCS